MVDFTERKGRALGAFDADRLRDRLLSTQRFRRGRGRDFIYTKNVARPRFGFYLRNEFRAAGVRFYLHKLFMGHVLIRKTEFSEQNGCCSQYNFRAARACSSEFIENNE